MPAADAWVKRQNTALRLRHCPVSLDVAGARFRLRATLPPKPSDPPGSVTRQQRISTGLLYPEQGAEAIELAEALGKALERHRIGVEPFDWEPWLRLSRNPEPSAAALDQISGAEAIEQARIWWLQHGKHRHAAESTWRNEYERLLRPLRAIQALEPSHLDALVDTALPKTRIRKGIAGACATVAQALGWPAEISQRLQAAGKGYTSRSARRREIPTDEAIERAIDRLRDDWQWAAGMVATYGCRPHEALKYAEVLPSGVARISGGKTGGRQSLALPHTWVERWDLHRHRRPRVGLDRPNSQIGKAMNCVFLRQKVGFQPYDLRHAWAVRAICDPRISPSLAAKSMGHSLLMHSTVYQRWFDGNEIEGVQALLSASS